MDDLEHYAAPRITVLILNFSRRPETDETFARRRRLDGELNRETTGNASLLNQDETDSNCPLMIRFDVHADFCYTLDYIYFESKRISNPCQRIGESTEILNRSTNIFNKSLE